MQVRVNGQFHRINGPVTIQGLLEKLGYLNQFVAVAINQHCVPKQQFPDQIIQDQDEIDILAPMAGG